MTDLFGKNLLGTVGPMQCLYPLISDYIIAYNTIMSNSKLLTTKFNLDSIVGSWLTGIDDDDDTDMMNLSHAPPVGHVNFEESFFQNQIICVGPKNYMGSLEKFQL